MLIGLIGWLTTVQQFEVSVINYFQQFFAVLSTFKVLLAARMNHVCVNRLHQVCFPNVIVNFLTIYSFVKQSGGTVANDVDNIAIGHCIETVSNFTENFST